MAETTFSFDDGLAYERFMGRWSRAVGAVFLDWVAPPKRARWLDVGCGTGVFTELILDTCDPAAVTAVDPAAAQIDHARKQPVAKRADFQVADAQTLPFADGLFDVVASALVINFIPDRPRALAEMRRVARPGGAVAGYVWDFAAGRSPNGLMLRALRQLGIEVPAVPGTDASSLEALRGLFEVSGLDAVEARPIDVTVAFRDFDDFWRTQPSFTPTGKAVAALPPSGREKLMQLVRAALPAQPDGTVAYSARANALKARAPG